MAFNWRDFLLFAHELRNEKGEHKQRTSIGRAYYYAYNVALVEAEKLGFNRNDPALRNVNGGSHAKLWTWCQRQTGNQDLMSLGNTGTTLRDRRTAADYHMVSATQITLQVVQKQLDETRDFELLLAQITKAPSPPPLP